MNTKYILFIPIIAVAAVAVLWFLNRSFDLGGPAISPTPTPSTAQENNIIVTAPVPDQKVESPIVVKGKARVFENTFSYILKDQSGNKLFEDHAMSNAADAGLFGDFEVRIPVPPGSPKNLIVEVFDYSAKDGSVADLVTIPVQLATQETAKVKVYFNNDKLDPQVSCNKVFPAERTISKTSQVAYIALFELLKGPTPEEKAQGYSTSIPENVRINSIKIENGRAIADFDYNLDYQVGGSCRVAAIRSQITNTLKQFPTVKEVTISINGRTEDILQP